MASRNYILANVAANDCRRYRERTVAPKRGKHAKRRPRNSNRARRERGEQ